MKYARKEWSLLDLFQQFIKDTYSGKRLKKDGKRIKPDTIRNYKAVFQLLKEFEIFDKKQIIIIGVTGNNKRHFISQLNRWKRF